jgi:hypothetical protein
VLRVSSVESRQGPREAMLCRLRPSYQLSTSVPGLSTEVWDGTFAGVLAKCFEGYNTTCKKGRGEAGTGATGVILYPLTCWCSQALVLQCLML